MEEPLQDSCLQNTFHEEKASSLSILVMHATDER
jgi:hypothetical protein